VSTSFVVKLNLLQSYKFCQKQCFYSSFIIETVLFPEFYVVAFLGVLFPIVLSFVLQKL
jgi:hypothetical protein